MNFQYYSFILVFSNIVLFSFIYLVVLHIVSHFFIHFPKSSEITAQKSDVFYKQDSVRILTQALHRILGWFLVNVAQFLVPS